jgi:methyltransferase-like protein
MSSISQEIQGRYDDLPYQSFPYPDSAPERLAAVAAIFGLPAPDVARARVLELGAASGGNLIPAALRHPHMEAVGVDISSVQVEIGRDYIGRLNAGNVKLQDADLLEVDTKALGQFDYIIAHGIYSWVPPEVQESILRIISECLRDDGVAFVSYNTYPGWRTKEILRDAMLMHGGARESATEQVAYGRAMLNFLDRIAVKGGLMSAALNESMAQVMQMPAYYVAHEYLGPYNSPCYFHQFVERIGHHGLAYLGEAQVATMIPSNYGEDLSQQLYGALGQDQVRVEQYLDFAIARAFRQTLLVKEKRAENLRWQLDQKALHRMHFAAQLKTADGAGIRLDGQPQVFVSPPNTGNITAGLSAIKQAIDLLARTWPGTTTREQLIHHAGRTQGDKDPVSAETLSAAIDELLERLLIRGMARFRLDPVEAAATVDERPVIDPAVRRQVGAIADHVTNAWHDIVEINEAERLLLPAMDGTLDRAGMIAMVASALRDDRLQPDQSSGLSMEEQAAGIVATMLDRLPETALLWRAPVQ